jgi:hypothetical protein
VYTTKEFRNSWQGGLGGGGSKQVQTFRATGSGALAETLAVGEKIFLSEIKLHVDNAPVAVADLTVTTDAEGGIAYDLVNITQPMAGVTDYKVKFGPDACSFAPGDELDFAWLNADGDTWGLEVTYYLGE